MVTKRTCAWCHKEIMPGQDSVVETDESNERRRFHIACRLEFREWYGGEDLL